MYCRMLQGEHSAILSTFIKQPFVIKIFVLSIFEWPFYAGFFFISNKMYRVETLNLTNLEIVSLHFSPMLCFIH